MSEGQQQQQQQHTSAAAAACLLMTTMPTDQAGRTPPRSILNATMAPSGCKNYVESCPLYLSGVCACVCVPVWMYVVVCQCRVDALPKLCFAFARPSVRQSLRRFVAFVVHKKSINRVYCRVCQHNFCWKVIKSASSCRSSCIYIKEPSIKFKMLVVGCPTDWRGTHEGGVGEGESSLMDASAWRGAKYCSLSWRHHHFDDALMKQVFPI